MARKKQWRDSSEFSDDEDFEIFRSENESRRRLNAYKIKRLKHNHPESKHVSFGREYFSTKAWRRLGSYFAHNDHVECMSLRGCNLNDDNMSVFFEEVAAARDNRSRKTKVLTLYGNSFGSGGMRSLVPFLKKSFCLASLNVSGNNIGTEGFWWLLNGLDGGSLEKLNLRHCGLANIAGLERCSLSNLQVLYLSDNINIGVDGCKSVAELLRRGGSKLKKLYVNRCNVGDAGAEIIAESLVDNKSLTHLELESNNIMGGGHLALLKLVNDISSIEGTCNSNHLLRMIGLKGNAVCLYKAYIEEAININRHHNGNLNSAGRAKVIKYHLNSNTRMVLSGLQGVGDYFMRPFVKMDSAILPDAVALVGQESGLSDMYRLLVARNSELGFSVYGNENRALKEKIVELNAIVAAQNSQIASLTARNLDLRTKLASINHFAKRIQSNIEFSDCSDEGDKSRNEHVKKRPRNDDF